MDDRHPIEGLMETAMGSIREMVDVNTIIGEPIETGDGTVIIPVSRVGFGFAAGGSDFAPSAKEREGNLFGGGSGAGVSISPVGFLVVSGDQIRLIPVSSANNTVERVIDYVPVIFDKINNLISRRKKEE